MSWLAYTGSCRKENVSAIPNRTQFAVRSAISPHVAQSWCKESSGLVHSAHAAALAHACRGHRSFFLDVRHEGFGGQHQRGDGRSIL